MPVKFKPGKTIRGYTITKDFDPGSLAFAYQAEKNGRKFFLKKYKCPAPRADWFEAYVRYAQEIKRRIEADDAARTRCYEMVEFFVERDFYQVFEFIDDGMALTDVVEKRDTFDWAHLVTFAKVMMSAIDALHKVGVVHTDLKPDNLYLLPDATISVGYKLRIIDLDFAILADQRAPWIGHMGFIGTDGYRSPEHIRGKEPLPASDVFTCGIMLSQILTGVHPLGQEIPDIEKATLSGEVIPFRLPQPIKNVDNPAFLEAVITSMLAPDPALRPTARQVAQALLGKTFDFTPWQPSPAPTPPVRPTSPPTADKPLISHAPSTASAPGLSLRFGEKQILTVRAESLLGKRHFENVHEDARFLSNPQFRLFRQDSGWMVEHQTSAVNATLVDGVRLVGAVPVTPGLTVSVGNPDKGISKFPLTLHPLP